MTTTAHRRAVPGVRTLAHRGGFTQVELLVVIAIIAVLGFGVLIPGDSCRTDTNALALEALEAIAVAQWHFRHADLEQDGKEDFATAQELLAFTNLLAAVPSFSFSSHGGHSYTLQLSPDRMTFTVVAVPLPPNSAGDPVLLMETHGFMTCMSAGEYHLGSEAFRQAVQTVKDLQGLSREARLEDLEAIVGPPGNLAGILAAADADRDGSLALRELVDGDLLRLARELVPRLFPGVRPGPPIGDDASLRGLLAERLEALEAAVLEDGEPPPEASISRALDGDLLALLYAALGHRVSLGEVSAASCGEVVRLPVLADSVEPITGAVLGIEWDPRAGIEVLEVAPGRDLPAGGLATFRADLSAAAAGRATAVLALGADSVIPPGPGIELLALVVRASSPPRGLAGEFCFSGGQAGEPDPSLSTVRAGATVQVIPRTACGVVTVAPDARPPLIICPLPIEVQDDGGGAVVTFEPLAADGCGEARVLCDPPSGSLFPPGTTAVVSTAVDGEGNVATCSFTVTVLPPLFRRGDANGDGSADMSDAVRTLFSFFGLAELRCPDAADFNDDGRLNVLDFLDTLNYLLRGAAPPAPPVGTCGTDPTPDALTPCEPSGCTRITIDWPAPGLGDLQSAIDAAPDGALVQIGSGVINVGPVFIRGKRLEIAGAGAGRVPGARLTHLVGPRARPVADAAGNVVLRAEAVTGLFNLIGSEVVIRDLLLTGSDAAVAIRNDERGNSGTTLVQDVAIGGAGRGILSLGSGDLLVSGCEITNTLWHGVSMDNASFATANILLVDQTEILAPICAGIYFANTTGFFSGVSVSGASCGGIVGYGSQSLILDSELEDNGVAAIRLDEAGFGALIQDNSIARTLPAPNGKFGDGIALFASPDVFVKRNSIHQSARAGVSVFGSTASLLDNTITCSGFDIDYEKYGGVDPFLDDLEGNRCACGGPFEECLAVSSSLEPPASIMP